MFNKLTSSFTSKTIEDEIIEGVVVTVDKSVLHDNIHDLFNILLSGYLYGIKSNNVDNLQFENDSLWPIETSNQNDNFSIILCKYIQQNNIYPLSKQLEIQKCILLSYFEKLLIKCSLLSDNNDLLYKQYLHMKDNFNSLLHKINKNLLLTIYANKSFKPLFAVYNDYINVSLHIVECIFKILMLMDTQYGTIVLNKSKRQIRYANIVNTLKPLLQQIINKKILIE